jgi:hypothetical protein
MQAYLNNRLPKVPPESLAHGFTPRNRQWHFSIEFARLKPRHPRLLKSQTI